MHKNEFNNVRIVLKSLMNGIPVEIEGEWYHMSVDFEILKRMGHYTIENGIETRGDDFYIHTHMSTGQFVKLCQKLTKDEVFLVAANSALNNM